ncbi:MAG TPA: hypothetical protein VLZ30_01485 [Verrucomicrobiae bacterium]|nr:hypothetical protein [Verrucomicrobiae bacterium]
MKEARCYRTGVLIAAPVIGLAITWVDTRPSWDDAGITAGLVVAATLILGALLPRQAWLSALAVGVWIPLVGVIRHGEYGTGLTLVFAFAGAYAGAFGRRLLIRETV